MAMDFKFIFMKSSIFRPSLQFFSSFLLNLDLCLFVFLIWKLRCESTEPFSRTWKTSAVLGKFHLYVACAWKLFLNLKDHQIFSENRLWGGNYVRYLKNKVKNILSLFIHQEVLLRLVESVQFPEYPQVRQMFI